MEINIVLSVRYWTKNLDVEYIGLVNLHVALYKIKSTSRKPLTEIALMAKWTVARGTDTE